MHNSGRMHRASQQSGEQSATCFSVQPHAEHGSQRAAKCYAVSSLLKQCAAASCSPRQCFSAASEMVHLIAGVMQAAWQIDHLQRNLCLRAQVLWQAALEDIGIGSSGQALALLVQRAVEQAPAREHSQS